jgi:predicted anti-sigma-YlaC factor YlaD
MKKNSERQASASQKTKEPETTASLRSSFRARYGCYAGNRGVLSALIEHELTPKFALAVRAHVWNCADCREAYDELRMLSAAHRQAAEVAQQLREQLPPVDRLRLAIKNGAWTQTELGRETSLAGTELIDALSRLLFQHPDVRTVIVNGVRVYFIDESVVQTDGAEANLLSKNSPHLLAHDQKELANRIAEELCRQRRTG